MIITSSQAFLDKVGKHSYFLQKTSLILYSTLIVGVCRYDKIFSSTYLHKYVLQSQLPPVHCLSYTVHLCFRFLVGSEREAGEETPPPCTLEDELKTPANRPSVQRLVDIGKTAPKYTHVWDDRTSLGYYPFKK